VVVLSAPTDEVAGDSLALRSVVRHAYGQEMLTELPDAHKGNSSDCLYARAFADIGVESVGSHGEMRFADNRIAATVAALWGTTASGSTVKAPEQFGQIIGQFDAGELKQYNL